VKHRSIVPAAPRRARVVPRLDLFSRLELENLHRALLVRYDETNDTEMRLQLGTLFTLCTLLLDDQANLSPAARAECQRDLLLDAADLGVTLTH
jgi:hypothetical protein